MIIDYSPFCLSILFAILQLNILYFMLFVQVAHIKIEKKCFKTFPITQ